MCLEQMLFLHRQSPLQAGFKTSVAMISLNDSLAFNRETIVI